MCVRYIGSTDIPGESMRSLRLLASLYYPALAINKSHYSWACFGSRRSAAGPSGARSMHVVASAQLDGLGRQVFSFFCAPRHLANTCIKRETRCFYELLGLVPPGGQVGRRMQAPTVPESVAGIARPQWLASASSAWVHCTPCIHVHQPRPQGLVSLVFRPQRRCS